MFSRLISQLRDRFKRSRSRPRPLVHPRRDVHVVQKLHGKKLPKWGQLRYMMRVLSSSERRVLRWGVYVFVVGVLWFGVGFVQAHRTTVPDQGGTYTEAVVGTPSLINPLYASLNDVDVDISRLIYSGLMRFDQEQNLVPDIAESYEISEDKRTYTFYLREGVTWHDGQPLSANDVVYTFDMIQDEQVNSPLRVSFQGVQVEAVDDTTVTFTLAEPFQPFLASLTVGIMPRHIWGAIPEDQLRLATQNLKPIGSGPFQFDTLVKDETGYVFQYEMTRFDEFYRQPAYIERFVFRFFPEYETDLGAIHALRQQKVDALHFVPSSARDKVERKHIDIKTLQLPQYSALFFNQDSQPALEEIDVRNALALALDKERIVRESLDNEGHVVYSPILPGFPGHSSSIEKTPYDVAEANALIDEHWERVSATEYREKRRAALIKETLEFQEAVEEEIEETATSTIDESTDDEDGNEAEEVETQEDQSEITTATSTALQEIEQEVDERLDQELHSAQLFYRLNDNDEILQLNLVTADTPEYRQVAELVAGFWQELGIVTNISYVSPKLISRDVLRDRNYDVLLYGIIVGSDPDQYPFWHSSQVEYPGLNLSQYVNRQVDETLEKIQKTDNAEELNTLYTSFQETLLQDRPAIFLYTPIYRYAQSDDVRGMNVERIFHPADRFADVVKWYIETKGKWQWNQEN